MQKIRYMLSQDIIACDKVVQELIIPSWVNSLYVTGFTKTVLNRTFGHSRNTKLKY